MTRWELLVPSVVCGSMCCIRQADGMRHAGIPTLIRIRADGSCHIRFSDDSTIDLAKEHT